MFFFLGLWVIALLCVDWVGLWVVYLAIYWWVGCVGALRFGLCVVMGLSGVEKIYGCVYVW